MYPVFDGFLVLGCGEDRAGACMVQVWYWAWKQLEACCSLGRGFQSTYTIDGTDQWGKACVWVRDLDRSCPCAVTSIAGPPCPDLHGTTTAQPFACPSLGVARLLQAARPTSYPNVGERAPVLSAAVESPAKLPVQHCAT